ncbi:MAG: S41 family peptidase, partial [Bacteroidales bacterium]|nr:S41 family peptidase [Bacteroidales bacterium]
DPIELRQQPGGEEQYTGNVVVLTNRSCYSATNDFVARMKVLDHVTIMGDKTGGGGGLPIYNELPNGWKYRFSATQTYDAEGVNIEGGIAPDIWVSLNPEDEANGVDSMIEAAVAYLNQQ